MKSGKLFMLFLSIGSCEAGFFGWLLGTDKIGENTERMTGIAQHAAGQLSQYGTAITDVVQNHIAPNISKFVNVTTESTTEFVRTTKHLASTVEHAFVSVKNMLADEVFPDIHKTGRAISESMTTMANCVQRLEERILISLNQIDEMLQKIGGNINSVSELTVVFCCLILFVLCNYIKNNTRHVFVTYEFLIILTILSPLTATAMFLRMFSGILRIDLNSADIVRYCVVGPIVCVFVWKILVLLKFLFCTGCIAIHFFIELPLLGFYITIGAPAKWTWNAYNYAKEQYPPNYSVIVMSAAVPWNALAIWFSTFFFVSKNFENSNETGYILGMFAAYIYFLITSINLYKNHQKPCRKTLLGRKYAGIGTRCMQLGRMI